MTTDRIYDEAARWVDRQQDEAMDWDGFTAWLEADPRHRLAYDELALIDLQLEQYSPELAGAAEADKPIIHTQPIRWRWWVGLAAGAIAAGVALVLVLEPGTHEIPVRDYRSPKAAMLQVALPEGAKIVLAPASQLTVQGNHVALRGAAYFDIPHRPQQALAISAGELQVADIGTRFSINDEDGGVAIDVAEGAVLVMSANLQSPVRISAGHGLLADEAKRTLRVINVDPQQVASWRTGTLQFDGAPLALVARDISRYSGEEVTVDPAIAQQPFSGVIAISHGEAPARTVAQILSLKVRQVDGRLSLEPRRP